MHRNGMKTSTPARAAFAWGKDVAGIDLGQSGFVLLGAPLDNLELEIFIGLATDILATDVWVIYI